MNDSASELVFIMPTKEEKEAAKLAKEEEKNRKKAEKEAAKLAKVRVPPRNPHGQLPPPDELVLLVSPFSCFTWIEVLPGQQRASTTIRQAAQHQGLGKWDRQGNGL